VGVEERGATRRELVEMRGLGHRMAAKVADPVVLIVDGDEEDVWLRRVGKRRAGRGEKECDEGE
jgi:hypothetical protein